MKSKPLHFLILCLFLVVLESCTGTTLNTGDNAIYYWRTTFSLSDSERDFLKEHDITKLYLRFFDVDDKYDAVNGEFVVPEATIQFKDSVPKGISVVPTIYITNSAMERMQLNEGEYAKKIFMRVKAICKRNGITFNELQLDCDWTKSTRNYFFRLCHEMKQMVDSTQSLSSTIRLHQLTQAPPPVDKCVLMVYNTGNLMAMSTENSIFSKRDIAPYLKDNRLSKYPLPLDVVYPTYGWSLLFHPGEDKYYFDRIMKRTDFSEFPNLKKIDTNIYEAIDDVNLSPNTDSWDKVYKGYRIRVERPTAKKILEIKHMIDAQLKGKIHNNILYHLDETQFSHYSDNEINKIYNRN